MRNEKDKDKDKDDERRREKGERRKTEGKKTFCWNDQSGKSLSFCC